MNTYHDKFLNYGLYDSMLSSTPPRSQFYHLQPLGLNTLYTESLTSYITRLSQAHCLTITDFLEQAILNFSIKKPKSIKSYSAVLIFGSGHGINGSGELANQWIDIIEQITMISDLQPLTMARWKNVIADQGLLRRRRAWCPSCYEMWHQNNQPLYDLLIWSIKEIILCPYHKQYLRTQCQYCLYKLPVFLRYNNIGYCPKCNKSLSTSESLSNNKNIVVDEDQIQQQLLIAKNIGELIAAAPELDSQLDSNIFNSNISRYFEYTTSSNKKRAVLHLQLPRTTTRNLINHKKIPKITTLLKISQKLKVTLLSLLTINLQIEHLESLTKSKIGTPEQSQKNKRLVILEQLRCPLEEQLESDEQPPPPLREVAKRLDCSVHTLTEFYPEISRKIEANYRKYHNIKLFDVQSSLEEALVSEADPPPRISLIARQFGYSSADLIRRFPELTRLVSERYHNSWTRRLEVAEQHIQHAIASNGYTSLNQIAQDVGCSASSLRRHFPDLCHMLAAKSRSPLDIEHLRHILKPFLAPQDSPPLPLMEVAKQLKIGVGSISKYCPDEAKAISAQYRTYQHHRNQQRKQRLADEARQATLDLYKSGIYPSSNKVRKRLSKSKNMLVPEVFAAWKQALAELNLPSPNVQDDIIECS